MTGSWTIRLFYLFPCFAALMAYPDCTGDRPEITQTSCNYRSAPAGIDPDRVRFGWQVASDDRNVTQSAFRILVARGKSGRFDRAHLVWDSGMQDGSQSLLVPYRGPALEPGTSYSWKVRIRDGRGHSSRWSRNGTFVTALSGTGDWHGAQWIAYDTLAPGDRIVPGVHLPAFNKKWKNRKSGEHILPLLRKEFRVKNGLKQALVFVCGLGQFELHVNGKKAGDAFLAPGWTDYGERCLYNTLELTDMLRPGSNALGVMLGNGFFNIPNKRYRKFITAFGNPKVILLLRLDYSDGTSEYLVSDATWKTAGGPLTFSSIYGGEDYDARLEQSGWDRPGFEDTSWQDAVIAEPPPGRLAPEIVDPVKVCASFDPVDIRGMADSSLYLYDFGQNASGIVRISISGNAGDTVRFFPAELTAGKYGISQRSSGEPYWFTYVLSGEGTETWQPRFSYYGFRYVLVRGAVPDTAAGTSGAQDFPLIHELKMLHTRNSAPAAGAFRCSAPLFDRIDSLIGWAIRSNFQSVLTDCPHREKLGWLEQSYLMGSAVQFNYNAYPLFLKMIGDMSDAQAPDGLIPDIAPEYVEFRGGFRDSPEWGSAAVILPWLVCSCYGDTAVLRQHWDMMTRYAAFLEGKSEGHILSYGLGDWNDLGPGRPGPAQLTPVALTATATWYRDITLLSRMARILGRTDQAALYDSLAVLVRNAFNNRFFDPAAKVYAGGSQTAMAMPLVLGLVPEGLRNRVLANLEDSIRTSGMRLTAGDIGYYYLVRALEEGGAADLLFAMNANAEKPGYARMLKEGATALTESWEALGYLSNNHLMLGHLMDWFYSGLAGIGQDSASTAYREIRIVPQVTGGIDSVAAWFDSPYGRIRSAWVLHGSVLDLEVSIPANCTATIGIPAGDRDRITEGGRPVRAVDGLSVLKQENGRTWIRTGSGDHQFRRTGPAKNP